MEHGILGIGAKSSSCFVGNTGGPAWLVDTIGPDQCLFYMEAFYTSSSICSGSNNSGKWSLHFWVPFDWLTSMSSQVSVVYYQCIRPSPTIGASCSIFGIMVYWSPYQETRWKHGRSNQQWYLVQCHLFTYFGLCNSHGQCRSQWFLSGLAWAIFFLTAKVYEQHSKWRYPLLISIPLSIGMSVWNMGHRDQQGLSPWIETFRT